MEDFTKSFSQSNPAFGRCIYEAPARELAESGYTTPLQAIESYQIKDGEMLNVSCEDISEQLKYFVDDLIIAIKDLDKRIIVDSKGKRRAFMFVTVPGNAYLRMLKYSDRFKAFITENEVGVYMTSSPVNHKDPIGEKDYNGGGYIKKATNNYWETKQYNISDFIKIINNINAPNNLGLTSDEINSHINILINIDQCNTGINLPGLNGVYIARCLDKDNPLSVQIPGRICRPDKDDILIIGNKETSAYSDNCNYVKPFGYIYIPVGLFTEEEFSTLRDTFIQMYYNNSLIRVLMLKNNIGLTNSNELNNTDKDSFEEVIIDYKHVKDPNWNTDFNKIDLLKDIMFGDPSIFKDKISDKIISVSLEDKIKIHSMFEDNFKNIPITNYNLELFYNKIKHFHRKF